MPESVDGSGPTYRTGPAAARAIGLLFTLFRGVGAAARSLGFGLFLAHVTLGIGPVLLCLASALQVITTGQGSTNPFGLNLDALDASFTSFLRSALVISHESVLPFGVSFHSTSVLRKWAGQHIFEPIKT